MLAAGGKHIILRTAWVYSDTGKNFVRTMLAAGAKLPKLRVVADQKGQPDGRRRSGPRHPRHHRGHRARAAGSREFGGIFHATGGGETTWYGLAIATFEEAPPL